MVINRNDLLLAIRKTLGDERAKQFAAAITADPLLTLLFASSEISLGNPDVQYFIGKELARGLFTQSELDLILGINQNPILPQ